MSITTPNMSLPVSTAGVTPGPDYALNVNAAMTIIDGHTHDIGSGIPITPLGLNISSPLTFKNQLATNLQGANFYVQTSYPTVASTLYVKLGTEGTPLPDLWYFDGTTQVQLTTGGAVAATAAAIPGESYAGGTFTWVQGAASTIPANFAIGSITISPVIAGAGSIGPTLGTNSGVSTAYDLQLPLPNTTGAPAFMTMDTAGNMGTASGITANQIAAGSIVGSQLSPGTITSTQIASGGIVSANIAAGTITGSNIASGTITGGNIAAGTITGSNIQAGTITNTQLSNPVSSGYVTPATSSLVNLYSATVTAASYMWVGSTVTVGGSVTVSVVNGIYPFSFVMAAPIGSVLAVGGMGMDTSSQQCYVAITKTVGGNLQFTCPNSAAATGSFAITFSCTYYV